MPFLSSPVSLTHGRGNNQRLFCGDRTRGSTEGINRTSGICSVLALFLTLFLTTPFLFDCKAQDKYVIANPYENVIWGVFAQHKGNLHTHTTISDGSLDPHQIVDQYHALGYTILSITDHSYMNRNPNHITFPWEHFSKLVTVSKKAGPYKDRDAKSLGMIPIKGSELSPGHDTGSYFNNFPGSPKVAGVLDGITKQGGLAVFCHPGAYSKKYTDDWYVDFYSRYPVLVGMEVYNKGDLYPGDRQLWDRVLTRLMPNRPVWGFSGDDTHGPKNIGRNWNVFLLPELTEPEVRKSMEKGSFYFVYSPDGREGKPARINRITVDKQKGSILIDASDCSKIEWISGGKVVHTGEQVSLRDIGHNGQGYVRARLYGIDGKSFTKTQPFGLVPTTELIGLHP